MSEHTRIIEVNGVKLEIDLRTAKRVDELKVGSRVKVLRKVYNDYKVQSGVIVGFEAFEKLPTIIVAYLKDEYNDKGIEFIYYNAKSTDTEIVASSELDQLSIGEASVLQYFENEITKRQREIDDLQSKKDFFLKSFGVYWKDQEEFLRRMEAEA